MPWIPSIESVVDVVLRVPPLFLMDSVLNRTFLSFVFAYDPAMPWKNFFMWCGSMTFFFLLGMVMFILSLRQLLYIYSYIINFAVLTFSYWWNYSFMLLVEEDRRDEMQPEFGVQREFYTHFVVQVLLAWIFCISNSIMMWNGVEEDRRDEMQPEFGVQREFYTHFVVQVEEDRRNEMQPEFGVQREFYTHFVVQVLLAWIFCISNSIMKTSIEDNSFKKNMGIHISFLLPLTVHSVHQHSFYFQWTPLMALFYPLIQLSTSLLYSLKHLGSTLYNTYIFVTTTISAIGIQAFVEDNWIRINVPRVLRVFCVARVIYQLSFYLSFTYFENPPPQLNSTEEIFTENLTHIFQHLLVRSCETFVSLLGTTSIVSLIAHYIGIFMAFVVGSDTEEDRNMGAVTAILFFLLALQTGLTGLEPDKRRVRIFRNFCLLSAAILHFIHGMVNPILLAISASRSSPLSKHCRVLGMCLFLVIYPLCLINYLWQFYSASPWLLAVTAFSIEVIIKVFISLTVYTLFIIDAHRDTFWEKLDDYIYCIQSTGNTIEFLFGIFMFCNGAWIMIFESGGFIRALMMCVHAYLNIFVQAKEGWKVFMRRRTAVHKINSLKEASTEDIERHNDVCAICYQELRSARITRCGHLYHSVCLRKWLYVQDNCPLCHKVIYKPPQNGSADKASQTSDNVNENAGDNAGDNDPNEHPHLD